MNRERLKNMYGSTPPGFEARICAALRANGREGRRAAPRMRRVAWIAALVMVMAVAAAAAFHSQVAAYFGWFYGGGMEEKLLEGDICLVGQTLHTPDAAYTMEEISRTQDGLYGVGRITPAEGVVLMPGDAQADDASALEPQDLSSLPGAQSYAEKAQASGARLVAVKVTPRAVSAPGGVQEAVDAAGYLLFPLEDGSLRFAFEAPVENAAEGGLVLTLWASRWEIAPDGRACRGEDGLPDTYERQEWCVALEDEREESK